ncbi:DUF2846 domain-containing protein [Microbacteriaceae bacterium K1510]|nr:DUF2846 domain-containing protein [Microbacteriaceae bacterium K1510]
MEFARIAAALADRISIARETRRFVALPIVLVTLFLMAGCAPTRTGATLDELNGKVGGPGGKQARIVVLRAKDVGDLFDSGWQVYLDEVPMGDLKTGTFVYRDRPAGPHKLAFARAGDLSRASTHDFDAASGRTYVFRLEMNDKGRLVEGSAFAAGLAGLLVSSAISDASDKRGFFDFTLLEGEVANQALADIHLAP